MEWANEYGSTHPVVADPNTAYTLEFIYASPTFDGYIYYPNMQLLSPGRVIEIADGWVSEGNILSVLP
ncbi:MAG: hypothetical protein VX278_03935 [Myxococcota bacterium]|nr:hypothetical protein [Myxococcota bacterium]